MINNSEILQLLKEKSDTLKDFRNNNSLEDIIISDDRGYVRLNKMENIMEIIHTYTEKVALLCGGDYELVALFSKYYKAIEREDYEACILIKEEIDSCKKQKGLL
jgi:thiamine monophosphate kinase